MNELMNFIYTREFTSVKINCFTEKPRYENLLFLLYNKNYYTN